MDQLGFSCYLIYYLLIGKATFKMLGLKAKVTWFNDEKKFGFAVPDALPIDVLIDLSDMSIAHLDLTTGQRVYIEVKRLHDGAFQATSLIPL